MTAASKNWLAILLKCFARPVVRETREPFIIGTLVPGIRFIIRFLKPIALIPVLTLSTIAWMRTAWNWFLLPGNISANSRCLSTNCYCANNWSEASSGVPCAKLMKCGLRWKVCRSELPACVMKFSATLYPSKSTSATGIRWKRFTCVLAGKTGNLKNCRPSSERLGSA